MNPLESLRTEIALTLSQVKAHTLPSACSELGLADGDSSEAYQSKKTYVERRLTTLQRDDLISLAKTVLERYPDDYRLEEQIENLCPSTQGVISAITRRNLVDELDGMGNLAGKLRPDEFLSRVFPLDQMPEFFARAVPGALAEAWDNPFSGKTLQECVVQHMLRNDDWSYKEFLQSVNFLQLSECRFRMFLEEVVHPEVRTGSEQDHFVTVMNTHLAKDALELRAIEETSGYPVYRIVKRGGVVGQCKNLIFAANGPKPELVLADAVNNDIRIVRNRKYCLIYDRPIGLDGLHWKDLVSWWADLANEFLEDAERSLYRRLKTSLASEPEKKFFRFYFAALRDLLKEQLPALIPQVYLHYDPYTLRELQNGSALARQRMDFLLLLPSRQRVVIEIDGQQHYSHNGKPSPQRYADMVAEDRHLRLQGYEVFRFGASEILADDAEDIVRRFFQHLLKA